MNPNNPVLKVPLCLFSFSVLRDTFYNNTTNLPVSEMSNGAITNLNASMKKLTTHQ